MVLTLTPPNPTSTSAGELPCIVNVDFSLFILLVEFYLVCLPIQSMVRLVWWWLYFLGDLIVLPFCLMQRSEVAQPTQPQISLPDQVLVPAIRRTQRGFDFQFP
jgi:hypothetical protein